MNKNKLNQKNKHFNQRKLFFLLLLAPLIFLSACGREEEPEPVLENLVAVEVISVSDSQSAEQEASYPAIVSAGMEARLSSQMSGVVAAADFNVGDSVKAGQILAQINEIGSNRVALSQASSNQIKQALIASQQAQESYQLARANYENILVSAARDLEQADINRQQAASGATNLDSLSDENIKSTELAYQTAKLASEQARLSLENREKQLIQSGKNIRENASLAANSASSVVGGIISSVNNLAAFDNNNVVTINYRTNLGALDSSSYNKADNSYLTAKNIYNEYVKKEKGINISEDLSQAIALLKSAKVLADDVKYLFDKSISSSNLPQSSPGGLSLASLQQQAAGFQSQINAALSQSQSVSQAWAGFDLDNSSILDSLRQAYALAKKQEESAKQGLSTLEVGNKSQQDQASFSLSLAANQYENIKVKLNSQVLAAKTQMDSALLQYNNATIALQSLYDSRSIVSPIDGKVFQKFVNNGDTIASGQTVALVGQSDGIKLKFFVEAENVNKLKIGDELEARDSAGEKYLGVISSVSAQADAVSKRFQVEANLINLENSPLLGTVLNVSTSFNRSSGDQSNIVFLPLSALEVGQNANYIYLVENDIAKKIAVEINSIFGEIAEIKADLANDAKIVVNGNKFLTDGQKIRLTE